MAEKSNHIPITTLINYVKGRLSQEEIEKLDALLFENNDAYEVLMELEQLRENGVLEEFLERMDERFFEKLNTSTIVNEYNLSPQKTVTNKVYSINIKLAIAASLALFLATSILFYFFNKDADFLNQYYEPYLIISARRGVTQTQEKIRDNAYLAYRKGDYIATINHLSEFEPSHLTPKDRLILVNSYISLEQHDDANQILNNLVTDKTDKQIYYHANWYKALLLIHNDSLNKAIEKLKIAQEDPNYTTRAKQIISEISY